MKQHHRQSIRLPEYNYSTVGGCSITVCTYNRECLFGEIIDGKMNLNQCGGIVNDVWNDLPNHYHNVELDIHAIMPNHFHGIIHIIVDGNETIAVGAGLKPAPTSISRRHKLSEIIRGFKTFSSRRINQIRNNPGVPVWQRNYYEHVIRQGTELDETRTYIINNPANWDTDSENINHDS